jgi:hypothetical protein
MLGSGWLNKKASGTGFRLENNVIIVKNLGYFIDVLCGNDSRIRVTGKIK